MKSINMITIINIVSTIVLQGLAFFTTPIFSRILGASQYGQSSLFFSWASIIACFMGLGAISSIATCKYQFEDEYETCKSSILWFGILFNFAVLLIMVLFNPVISEVIKCEKRIIYLLAMYSFSQFIVSFCISANTYEKKALENFVISLILSLSSIVLSLIYIYYYCKKDELYMGRIYGTIIPYSILAIILFFKSFLKNRPSLKKKYIRYSIKLGIPIVFHMLSGVILSQSDRVMMQMFGTSNKEIGIYSLFYSLVNVVTVILQALNNSWCPFLYDDLKENEMEKLKKKSKNYIELFSVMTIGFILLSREVGMLMGGDEYYIGTDIIPILVLAVFFTFMYQFPVNVEFFEKKTSIIAAGTIVSGLINIVLNYFMIPKYGMYGAGIATMLSYFILMIAHYIIAFRLMKDKMSVSIKNFLPWILLILIAILVFFVMDVYWYIRWAIGGLLGFFEAYRVIKRKSIF